MVLDPKHRNGLVAKVLCYDCLSKLKKLDEASLSSKLHIYLLNKNEKTTLNSEYFYNLDALVLHANPSSLQDTLQH